ncbi:hypothetical protein GCM10011354_11710 [Egicoccus halophilus]|uniref:PH domain-containing protein n=1 Tax=Egicoccus halophilus TaxID=1670830 RepID=A0A8J3ERH9_9ACTN|nr:hypothetical protein GCM10011354_11710 [Egicoccus halophilus]
MPLVAAGAPEAGVVVALAVALTWVAATWRIALSRQDGEIEVRNLWSTRRIARRDVDRIGRADSLPWYWPASGSIVPMLEVQLHSGAVVRLHATALPGVHRRQDAAEFVSTALKMSPQRLHEYVHPRS